MGHWSNWPTFDTTGRRNGTRTARTLTDRKVNWLKIITASRPPTPQRENSFQSDQAPMSTTRYTYEAFMARNSQQTRQRILDAAYALFRRKGYARVSMDEIAAATPV